MKKDDLKISQADFDKTKVSRLSDRPNVGYGYGGRALSAQELKERYDASAVLIREHFNALIDALAGEDENGERIPGVADLILTGIAASYTLADLFEGLGDGSAMQYIKAGIDNYSVKGYLQYLATRLADKLEGSRIEATAQMLENGKAPTVSVRMDGQGEDKTVRFDFGIPEGKEGKEGPQGIPGEKGDPGIVELADKLGDSESMALSQKATTREIQKVKNDSSNALKGSVTGSAVRMDDVSPVAHEMAVKVSGVDDPSAVKVLKFGKNLINRAAATVTNGTLTFDRSKQTFASTNGGGDVRYTIGNYQDLVGKEITISYTMTDFVSSDGRTSFNTFVMAGKTEITRFSKIINQKAVYTFTVPENPDADKLIIRQFVGYMTSAAGDYVTVDSLQVEIGDAATEWEDFSEMTEHAVNADGTVDGVTPILPTTTLMTDTDGAIIDVEYNRDINKAFDELKNAIIALGGNV